MQELRGEMQELRGEMQELRGEMQEVRGEMQEVRGEMKEMRGELMRHAMVLTESVRDDVRVVAEGLAVVSAKLDALRRKTHLRHARRVAGALPATHEPKPRAAAEFPA
jgi:uncharacterized coiled-coil DUF342 family protein